MRRRCVGAGAGRHAPEAPLLRRRAQLRIFEVCNPAAASQVLAVNIDVSTVLPCRVSVYDGDNGHTVLSTFAPTTMLGMFGERVTGLASVAAQIEAELVAAMDEAVA